MHYGIDIGGTKIEIARFDADWERLDHWRQPTPAADGEALLDTLSAMVAEADRRTGDAGTLGIGVPGVIDPQGRLIAANLPGLRHLSIVTALASRFARPIALENDSRCFIVSEIGPGGSAEGAQHAFGAILGTGAGGGAVVDGRLLRGSGGFAGEWGHLPLSASARDRYSLPALACGCGLEGCLERYVSGPGLVRLHRHFGGDAATAEEWHRDWLAGASAAVLAHECHLDLLGEALANVVKLLAPQIIVLGGGLSALECLLDGLPGALSRHLFPGIATPRIVRSRFGDASGVRGAAMQGAALAQRPANDRTAPSE
ncbi:ROK family protein [Salinicola aestuarinus]|uniref:ROK family protein n=1 Tax=Salinicola aestuarinus TaxID=1949082 RepID=UPI000DA1A261|nr:ROK family protein [Salinicola aestuarinus]